MSRESRDAADVLDSITHHLRPYTVAVDHAFFGDRITMKVSCRNNHEMAAVQTLTLEKLVKVVGMQRRDAAALVARLSWKQV